MKRQTKKIILFAAVALAIIVLVAFVVVLCNFLADALYRVMDPRLKGR